LSIILIHSSVSLQYELDVRALYELDKPGEYVVDHASKTAFVFPLLWRWRTKRQSQRRCYQWTVLQTSPLTAELPRRRCVVPIE
jgi:hypothetical protein